MKNKTSSYFTIQLAALGLLLVGVFFLTCSIFGAVKEKKQKSQAVNSWWSIQSIDTMKYSRDLTREKMGDTSFNSVIDEQVGNIAKLGATHVGIATPYDEEFIPMLSRWVDAARKHNLKVWFRGNFSGWEQWFGYSQISREQHMALLSAFIESNPQLFQEGDIFTPCPECENGGPGDPRQTGDITGHRLFLIKEYDAARAAFRKIGIGVNVGYFSMNYDVARAIMDTSTTEALGGIVTIDHYVATPEQLVRDIRTISEQSGGNVFLGEFGAPIPDIHGTMTEQEQSRWIASALNLLAREPSVIGINYWVNVGGSTQLWTGGGNERQAVATLTRAFSPLYSTGMFVDQFNKPITNVEIASRYKKMKSDQSGQFIIPYFPDETDLRILSGDYTDKSINIKDLEQNNKIIIKKQYLSVMESVLAYILSLYSKFR